MVLRIFTLIIVFLQIGVPYMASLNSGGHFTQVYQNAMHLDNPLAVTAWIIWTLWMVYPIINFFRLSVKYPF